MNETAAPESDGNLNQTAGRLWELAVRRRWWILTAGCSIPIAVVAVAMKLPDKYVSQATVLVVQQQVSQRYVQLDSTTTVADAVQAMKLNVLSARRLLAIVNDFGLYTTEKNVPAPELLVEKMRQDIDIQPLEGPVGRNDFTGFTVAFRAATPHLAQDVTSRLISLFIEENSRTRGEQAASTSKFLSDQLAAAKQRLMAQEQRLQAFKTSNAGELPEQQQSNLLTLADLRERLETVATKLSQVQQQQANIESSLLDRLNRLQSEKAQMLTRLTPRHPDVAKKDREIGTVESALDHVRTGTPAGSSSQDASPDDTGLAGTMRQAGSNIAEIASLTKQQQELKRESEQYQARLNLAPVREQQLDQILRDYDLFKQDYSVLEKNEMQSQLATSVEENQEGQHFQLVEPPTLPVKPTSPKRLTICLGGAAAGILLGLLLAFLVDSRKSAFYNERAVAQSFALPLVLGVPWVLTPAERRVRAWKVMFEWVVGGAMSLMMLAAEFYVYRKG